MRLFTLFPLAACAALSLSAAGCTLEDADAEAEADTLEGTSAEKAVQASDPCALAHNKTVDVKNASELSSALSKAKAGTMIRLAAGTYEAASASRRAARGESPSSSAARAKRCLTAARPRAGMASTSRPTT